MLNRHHIAWMLAIVMTVSCMSCSSYEEKRSAARLRYQKATATAKLPLAEDLFENGQYEDARKTVQECLTADPENPEANLLMGRIEKVQGRLTSAREFIVIALEYDETLDAGWFALGEIAYENKRPARALEHFNRAIELQPLKVEYILALGETLALGGDYNQALELYESKSRILAGNAKLMIACGDIKNRLGDTNGAVSRYRQAAMLDPDNVSVIESLGYCYISMERWDEASIMFEKLIELSSGTRKSSYTQMLAMCSMKSGKYARAVSSYNSLTVDNRDDASLWLQMGQAALGADAPNRALACANRALSIKPGWTEAVALKGCSQYLSSDYAESITTFRGLTSDKQLGGFAWLMTGRSYQQMGQLTQAQIAYENASRLNPDSKLVSLLTDAER